MPLCLQTGRRCLRPGLHSCWSVGKRPLAQQIPRIVGNDFASSAAKAYENRETFPNQPSDHRRLRENKILLSMRSGSRLCESIKELEILRQPSPMSRAHRLPTSTAKSYQPAGEHQRSLIGQDPQGRPVGHRWGYGHPRRSKGIPGIVKKEFFREQSTKANKKQGKASPERASQARRWKRVMKLHTSIVAGAKPETLALSDGHSVQVYHTTGGEVNFLTNGPKQRLDDLGRRMQEGEALVSHLKPHYIRNTHKDQTEMKEYYSIPERLRVMKARQWVRDLERRLQAIRSIYTAKALVAPKAKQPRRLKWISLATWRRIETQHEETSTLNCPPTMNEPLSLSHTTSTKKLTMRDMQPQILDNFSHSWTTRFERMCLGEGLDLYVLNGDSLDRILDMYASTNKSFEDLQQAWTCGGHFEDHTRTQLWEDLMLWCLHKSPQRALHLLNVSIRDKTLRPSRYVANDCLAFLTNRLLVEEPCPDALRDLRGLTRHFLKDIDAMKLFQPIDDNIIYLLVRHSDDAEALSLMKFCLANGVTLHANTLLNLLHRSVEFSISFSVEVLRSISKSGYNMSSDQIQKACVRMIRTRVNNDKEYRFRTKIVTQLLEIGIFPRIAMYNAIILNAVEARDFDTAWQLYDVARTNKLEPDSTTYGLLLKSARLSGDHDVLEKVIREVLNNPPAMQDLRLLCEILNAVSYQHLQGPLYSDSGFRQLLDLYRRYCSLGPLRDLGMCGLELGHASDTPFGHQWPTRWILSQMLASYTHSRHGQSDLVETYHRYHKLVLEGHPLISTLAETDFIGNTFIMAFGAHPETLEHCTTVLKHMLEEPIGPIAHKSIVETNYKHDRRSQSTQVSPAKLDPRMDPQPGLDATNEPALLRRRAKPTIRTWSILVAAYFRNNQKFAAEKVVELMRARGIQPDQVTWNTLVSGYAGMQDTASAVDAVERMQAAGYETNTRTMLGLGRLWDRERLLNALKMVTQPNRVQPHVPSKEEKESAKTLTEELAVDTDKDKAESYLAGIPFKAPYTGTMFEDDILEPESVRNNQKVFEPATEKSNLETDNLMGTSYDESNIDPEVHATMKKLLVATFDNEPNVKPA